jgi:hypothetical protein
LNASLSTALHKVRSPEIIWRQQMPPLALKAAQKNAHFGAIREIILKIAAGTTFGTASY